MKTETITFTTKGQLVIPAPIRRKLGITDGTRATVREEGGKIIIHPVTESYVRSLRGSLKHLPVVETLSEERRKEGGN
jgi:AbrB family looped-hinge helix DNA binding protein